MSFAIVLDARQYLQIGLRIIRTVAIDMIDVHGRFDQCL